MPTPHYILYSCSTWVCVSVCLCVCMHVFTCLCIQGNALMHTWTPEIRSTELVSFLENSLPWFLKETGSFVDLRLSDSVRLVCQGVPNILMPLSLQHWNYRYTQMLASGFYFKMGYGIKLRSLHLHSKCFVHWAISPADISYDKHIQYSSWLEYKTLHL